MKQTLKRLLPGVLVRAYQGLRRYQEGRRNAGRSASEVFGDIYRQARWGQGQGPFCSGPGTASDAVVRPYLDLVTALLGEYGPGSPAVVDLGCGDFSVGWHLVDHCASYVGVDVVPQLIEHLARQPLPGHARFVCLDITRDPLPPGDVCFVRQVLQHLSNQQILQVLPKLRQYKAAVVTEHHPSDRLLGVPNRDKVHGADIRLFNHSGVYLDRPPFDGFGFRVELLLEVPAHDFGGTYEPGVIRTFRLTRDGEGAARS